MALLIIYLMRITSMKISNHCGGLTFLCAGINIPWNRDDTIQNSIQITVDIMKIQAKNLLNITSDTLCRLTVWTSKMLIVVGGYKMQGLTRRQSVKAMIDEWDDIMEQTNGTTQLAESFCLLPDAITLACEFGYIGRARKCLVKRAQGLLHPSKNSIDEECNLGGCDTLSQRDF